MDERQQRLARNEALFRSINDKIEGLNEAFQIVTDGFEILCECGNRNCVEQITVPTPDYQRIREDPELFMLVAGHEDTTAERVVEHDHGHFNVVRKHPESAARSTADSQTDP